LDLLREYLRFRCKTEQKENGDEMEVDEEDDDIDDVEDEEALLPQYQYSLNDEIWDNLSNIRSYSTLPIESKLEIIKILFQDAMSTNVMINLTNQRIEKYQEIKYDIKAIDDEYSNMIKEEKSKLRKIRNELTDKKRILNPKKGKKKKKMSAVSSSSSASSSTATSKSPSNSPNKENNSAKSNSGSLETTKPSKRITSRQQELLRKKKEKQQQELKQQEEKQMIRKLKEKEKLKQEVEKLDNSLKHQRNLMNQKCASKELEIAHKKFELLRQCRLRVVELGSDRFYNKYFWSLYSDGRIFIFHPNSMYHQLNTDKNNSFSISKEIMSSNIKKNDMKCCNEWESMMNDENGNGFCWSFVSTSTEFYNLLNILDERGIRESELLLTLNALKNDIIRSMRMIGNDNYKDPMIVDDDESISEEVPKQLRRSKRATKNSTTTDNHIQSSNKGFLSYRNRIKRK